MDLIRLEEEKLLKVINDLGYKIDNVSLVKTTNKNFGDYQYNGVMSLSKEYHENPRDIANKIVDKIDSTSYDKIEIAGPGFINFTLSNNALTNYINDFKLEKKESNNKVIVLDYGGPNVAKALHVGHLRSANIGEALKRLANFNGYKTISDVHLGDFGRPLGLIILELKKKHPDWVYFDEEYNGEYPTNDVVTNEELIDLYPIASNKAKEDESYLEEARLITKRLQNHEKGYYELWKNIVNVSVREIKKIYKELNVSFDYWYGESDADSYTSLVIDYLTKNGYTSDSQGAKVVYVNEENDKLEIPPVLLVKSNGSISYETTDIATIYQRVKDFNPDEIWYVVDNRQSLHFEQVFRACYKSKIVDSKTKLRFLGFGTMNGKDGKPYKTRDGGVMSLENLINMVYEVAREKTDKTLDNNEEIAKQVGIASLKYADLLSLRSTDYIFDLDKFCDLNGKTGAYLLYTMVRIKSLLKKSNEENYGKVCSIYNEYDKDIVLKLMDVNSVIDKSMEDKSLNHITDYLYELCKTYNSFYDNNRVLNNNDNEVKQSWLNLSNKVLDTMNTLCNILGINVPDKM